MNDQLSSFFYLFSCVLFIWGLYDLSDAKTARRGNTISIVAMLLAIVNTLLSFHMSRYDLVFSAFVVGGFIGGVLSRKISMTALPQLVAGFHSLVGLSAVLVALGAFYSPHIFLMGQSFAMDTGYLTELSLGAIIGAITFTGSLVAFMKLQGILHEIPIYYHRRYYTITFSFVLALILFLFLMTKIDLFLWLLIGVSFLFGLVLILPVGGADMPVVVSMLNSYSGWAAAGIGFSINNHLLLIAGALVGSSGAILSYIMCKAMNRSLLNVLFGESEVALYQTDSNISLFIEGEKPFKKSTPQDAAYVLSKARSVIVIPGYGMAVAHAQHALSEIVSILKQKGVCVRFAIHPVAGRMPGHMNVLLAEADISYGDIFEMDDINHDFEQTDVAFVIGANDITNPAARHDKTSSIYGMPILDVDKAKTVFFVKRSMAPGYAGIDNALFYEDNTMMLLGDAKDICEKIIAALK